MRAALGLALVAACGRAPTVGERLMASIDPNGDGALDAAEFTAIAAPGAPFGRWDVDGDGRIDAGELEARLWDTSPLVDTHQGVEARDPLHR